MTDNRKYTVPEILTAATKANYAIEQWVPQSWIDALLKSLRELPGPVQPELDSTEGK